MVARLAAKIGQLWLVRDSWSALEIPNFTFERVHHLVDDSLLHLLTHLLLRRAPHAAPEPHPAWMNHQKKESGEFRQQEHGGRQ